MSGQAICQRDWGVYFTYNLFTLLITISDCLSSSLSFLQWNSWGFKEVRYLIEVQTMGKGQSKDSTLSNWNFSCMCLVAQSCLTLCNPMDCSPSGSSVHGILQARILEGSPGNPPGGLPCPPPGDLPHPGMEPRSLVLQAVFCMLNHNTTLYTRQ